MDSNDATHQPEPPAERPEGEAAPVRDGVEARRERRLRHLEMLRTIGMEMAAALGHATAGRVQFHIQAFADTHDPALAFSRLALAVRRIVALEERLEEDGETRAARITEEQAQRAAAAARQAKADAKLAVRRVVRSIHREAEPDMTVRDRERLLNDLFRDYDDYEEYGGTMAETVRQICAALGVAHDPALWREDAEDEPANDIGPNDTGPDDEDGPEDAADDESEHPRVDPAVWEAALRAFDKKHGTDIAARNAHRSRGRGPPS